MRIKRRNTQKKPLIIAVSFAAIVAIGMGYLTYAYITKDTWPFDSSSSSVTSESTPSAETPQDNTYPDAPDNNTSDAAERSNNKTPKQFSPPPEENDNNESEASDDIRGTINSKSVNGSILSIRTTIPTLLGKGVCKLTLTRVSDAKKVSMSADIVQNPSSSSCKGFDVSTSKLGQGLWKITIRVTSGSKTGVIEDTVRI